MIELNAKELGEEIKRLRKANKLSQSQLAEGICTQATISGIEAGRGYPSLDILYILSIRLKVTLDYFYKILLNDTQNYIQETEQLLENLLKNKDYKQAYEISHNELKQNKRQLGYKFNQIIHWVHIISAYYLGKIDWQTAIERLTDLLNSNHPLFGQDFIDIKIQNSLAIIFAENKRYKESLEHYQKILTFKNFLHQQYQFHIKIHYNLSKLYYLQEDYGLSLTHVICGIRLSEKNEDISMAGQLYFQKGLCLEKLDKEPSPIKDSFLTSLFIFKLLKKENYIQMIKEQRGDFFAEDS